MLCVVHHVNWLFNMQQVSKVYWNKNCFYCSTMYKKKTITSQPGPNTQSPLRNGVGWSCASFTKSTKKRKMPQLVMKPFWLSKKYYFVAYPHPRRKVWLLKSFMKVHNICMKTSKGMANGFLVQHGAKGSLAQKGRLTTSPLVLWYK